MGRHSRGVLPLYDAHNHFHDEWLQPHQAALDADLRGAGLRRAVVNGACEADWPVIAGLARRYDWVLPSYGVHPWDCGNRSPNWLDRLRTQLAADPRAAVGEIGLDRWILDSARPDDPRLAGLRRAPLAEQGEVMLKQLALATTENRPVSIHCLQAFGALEGTLRHVNVPARGFLLHAYGGPAEMVKPLADLGAYFSFNAAFVAERHVARREVFRLIPANRLLLETDAPAMPVPPELDRFPLPPSPTGERINHPANITLAYNGLAEIRSLPLTELTAVVEANFTRFFLS
ncbi:MAG: TatD family hydrolase [Opitutales bacterium]